MASKGAETKQRLITAAAQLMQIQGLGATGLSAIVNRAQAPRGSLYFHFPGGRDELALSAVKAGGAGLDRMIDRLFADEREPADAVERLGELMARALEASDFASGCPLATVALESAAVRPHLSAACAESFDSCRGTIAGALRRAAVPEPEERAVLVLSAVEGALVLAKSARDVSPLRVVAVQLRPLLRGRIDAPARSRSAP